VAGQTKAKLRLTQKCADFLLNARYSQLPSISGGRLLHPQPEDAPCHGDRDPLNMVLLPPLPLLPLLKRNTVIVTHTKVF
jgi:hypothetical protein